MWFCKAVWVSVIDTEYGGVARLLNSLVSDLADQRSLQPSERASMDPSCRSKARGTVGNENIVPISRKHTSQNMHPASDLDMTYSALIFTMSGTSYETSSRLTGS